MILLGLWLAGFGIEFYWEQYWPSYLPFEKKFYVEFGTMNYMLSITLNRLELNLYTPIRKKNEHEFKQKINH
jgi:hypothetical protein